MSSQTQPDWPPGLSLRPTLLFLAMLVACALVNEGCKRWTRSRNYQAKATAAAPYLEAANAEHRRVGLWPVVPALNWRTYNGDSLAQLYSVMPVGVVRRYQPYVSSKYILYRSGRLVWEQETMSLCPTLCQAADERAWELKREYSFTAAAAGRSP